MPPEAVHSLALPLQPALAMCVIWFRKANAVQVLGCWAASFSPASSRSYCSIATPIPASWVQTTLATVHTNPRPCRCSVISVRVGRPYLTAFCVGKFIKTFRIFRDGPVSSPYSTPSPYKVGTTCLEIIWRRH
ncbi:hypothetical protein H4582DRAFT_1360352 [Lactarius indigo]|nr:hypothetical protein H4582DRAFT_1360352 [Lactarius indigo]